MPRHAPVIIPKTSIIRSNPAQATPKTIPLSNTNTPTNPMKISTPDSKLHVDVKKNDMHLVIDVVVPNSQKRAVNIFDAIKAKDFDIISLYVKAGGDVNVKSNEGYTPLMQAIQNGWSATEVKKMLEKMPNVDLKLEAIHTNQPYHKYGKPIDVALDL